MNLVPNTMLHSGSKPVELDFRHILLGNPGEPAISMVVPANLPGKRIQPISSFMGKQMMDSNLSGSHIPRRPYE